MQVETPLYDGFYGRYTCSLCYDAGLWLTPKGDIRECPTIARRAEHPELNRAALTLRKSIESLQHAKQAVDGRLFEIARMLIYATTEKPCPREDVLKTFFSYLPMTKQTQLRNFHSAIEDLRRVWLLPIGSRKDAPSGYWMITDIEDFSAWVERSKSAPITQLSTIHRVAKRNFPIFAEQMELDFWHDIETNDLPTAA